LVDSNFPRASRMQGGAGIPGDSVGRAMVCILLRSSRAKIPMVTPNKPDLLTKKIRLGIYRNQIRLGDHDNIAEGRQAEPHTHRAEEKETHELIFSWLS